MTDIRRRVLGRTGLEVSTLGFGLRFTLSHPALDTTIVGTSNLDHLHSTIATAVAGPLPGDVIDEAKRRLYEVGATPA